MTYSEFEPHTNRNATVDNTISVNRNKDLFDDSSVVRTLPSNNSEEVDLYSPFEDADLNDTKKWEVESIDTLGRVSFSAIDNNNNKQILDWNTTKGAGNELYANVGKDNGYVYDEFELDYNTHRLKPISLETKPKVPNKPTTISVVDTSKISCEVTNSVDVLFGSENYMGFKLPTDDGCECDIDITLDFMLKYNANSLNNCLGNICNIGIINQLSKDSLNCRNFLVFTQNEETSINLQNNISKEEQKTNIKLWDNTIQLDPNTECCKALGGEVINSDQLLWVELNNSWVGDVQNKINEYKNNPTTSDLTPTIKNDISGINQGSQQWDKIKTEISNCIEIEYPKVDFKCTVNVNDYVTTSQICALPIDMTCGIYTYLSEQLNTINTHVDYAIIKLEECVEKEQNQSAITDDINIEIINGKTKKSQIKNTAKEEEGKNNDEIKELDRKIQVENEKISTKNSDNEVIDIAINGINPKIDCTIYQQTINELQSINVSQFCENSRDVNDCIQTKTESINSEIKNYNDLLTFCQRNNGLNTELDNAKIQNNQTQIDYLVNEINLNNKNINDISDGPNGTTENNINLQTSEIQNNDKIYIINKTAELLGENVSNITDKTGNLKLTNKQQIDLKVQKSINNNEINKLNTKRNDLETIKSDQLVNKEKIEEETRQQLETINRDIEIKQNIKEEIGFGNFDKESCCNTLLTLLFNYKEDISKMLLYIESKKNESYEEWFSKLSKLNSDINYQKGKTYIDYMDDLKVNFNLFVKQSNGNTTKLPYTKPLNPVWEWKDPSTTQYSGIIIGDDDNAIVEQDIIYSLVESNIVPSDTLFDPQWQNISYNLPGCVCEDLKIKYPNGDFYFSLEIENLECDVCLIVDNIEVNISDCDTQKEITLTNCLIPELSCVIDNKKSWVYNTGGIEYQTIYPDGECNTGSTNNYDITKLIQPEERLWPELEYRYTEYSNPHSDLIMNTKSTVFAIDPANAIECDVYNFWKNIECEDCPTSCDLTCYILGDDGNFLITEDNCSLLVWCNVDSDIIKYNGVLRETPSEPLSGYSLTLSGCSNDTFSGSNYTNFLEYKLQEMKNEFYYMTGEYNESLNSNYYQFKDKGGNIDNFGITKNNCGSDTIIMGNYKDVNELFGLLVEDINGTLSLYEIYTFDGSTPYLSGNTKEILTGYSAQTFNQTEHIDKEFCEKINFTLNTNGTEGFGLGKDYKWSNQHSACTWTDINNSEGDCTYCGEKQIISYDECKTGTTSASTATTVNVCISPLEFLDVDPKTINVKETFDELVLSNLIDAKSRQVISNYPMLKLFYQLYLSSNNCGKEFSGKLTYNDLFNFMDKIGDYWLDLLEQVVPATTIWEGCDNSGKLYRNTIFDQNKYQYRRYVLNYNDSEDCELSAITENVIASATTDITVIENSLTPSNNKVIVLKNNLNKLIGERENLLLQIDILENSLCALKLQDSTTKTEETIASVQSNLKQLLNQLNDIENKIDEVNSTLIKTQNELAEQQSFYQQQILEGCKSISDMLTQAEKDLNDLYTPYTVSYERQRDYIAGLKNKYKKCINKTKTQTSKYDTIFITQIYDSNEYEGSVNVIGDSEWEVGGPFFNNSLIHDCTTQYFDNRA